MTHTSWKTGTDLFGETHVYDSGGDRLTNDRMSRSADWKEIARLIAAAPDMLEALKNAQEAVEAALTVIPRKRDPHHDDNRQKLVNLAAGLLDGIPEEIAAAIRKATKTEGE